MTAKPPLRGRTAGGPADVAGERELVRGVRGVVAAIEGEVAQRGELGFDPVHSGGRCLG